MRGTKCSDLSGPTVHSLYCGITTVKSRYVELSRATKDFSRGQEFDIARVASNFTPNIFIADSYMLKHRIDT